MEGDFIKINRKLIPLSWLYGLGVGIRNFGFEVGILKSRAFSVPIISVGNITVGGTGKTPHVEHLIRLLKENCRVAVLSRGYKRKTSGYQVATAETTARDIGDEPQQMHLKFPDVTVAVDKKRVRAIERLTADDPELDVILLDDAFQHRYVKPGINILLVDYHRLIIYDRLLPAGRLREPQSGKNRADIVIVTKCPRELKPMDFRVITKAMDLYPYQHLFFTTLDYQPLRPVFPDEAPSVAGDSVADTNVLLLTGIASPRQIIEDLTPRMPKLTTLSFPDHHNFRRRDIERINREFAALPQPRIIVTTEKDAARLRGAEGLSDEVRRSLYVQPVSITFMQADQEEKFNQNIIGYVRKNSRNSILAKGKDDHKTRDSHSAGNGTRTISFRNN
ncbi:MAG: tetraacyldisaccharide 4'-kinase [Prevotella sp.]|nr:tetraacyldisaccharide 4'-kinase [Prevotella sp.]